MYKHFPRRPAHPREAAGSRHHTSGKAPWLELQLRAGQTPEHGAMKLGAAFGDIPASSKECSGKIPLLLVLSVGAAVPAYPGALTACGMILQTSTSHLSATGAESPRLRALHFFHLWNKHLPPPRHLLAMQLKPFPVKNQICRECLY